MTVRDPAMIKGIVWRLALFCGLGAGGAFVIASKLLRIG